MKLPTLSKKLRVALGWVLDLCFAPDTVQLLTIQSVRSGRLEELLDGSIASDPQRKAG
jgi:hypothetical protein